MIIYNAGKIKTYENLKALAILVGEDEKFADELWEEMLKDEELIEEFNYFVFNKTLKGKVKCGDYTLLDIYFSQMKKYNLYHDLGKNPVDCIKERMVLNAFKCLTDMRRDPQKLIEFEMSESDGMDFF